MMRISRNGLLFIARREALVLSAYPDGPHMSVGFGHNSALLKPGDTITVKQAFDQLKLDMAEREADIAKALAPGVSLTQQQFDALMSLHYQSGFRYLPAIMHFINQGHVDLAMHLWPECDHNKAGEKLEGLHKRRLLELAVFTAGDYGELSPIPFWRGDPRDKRIVRESYDVKEDDL